jgi:CHAD domain-containing protein
MITTKFAAMLSEKRQSKYILRIKRQIALHLDKDSTESPQENLHHLRVAIKKLRSLKTLNKSPEFNKSLYVFNNLFKQSGRVRDIYIANLIEEKYNSFSAVSINMRQKEFFSRYNTFISQAQKQKKSLTETCNLMTKQVYKHSVQDIMRHYKKALTKIADDLIFRHGEEIHECRKQVKNLLYFHETIPGKGQKQLNLSISYLDELQNKIGLWHDIYSAEPLLKKRIQDRRVILSISEEKKNLMKSIKKMGENFLAKARKNLL